jgi:S1-C subfamily serine protease
VEFSACNASFRTVAKNPTTELAVKHLAIWPIPAAGENGYSPTVLILAIPGEPQMENEIKSTLQDLSQALAQAVQQISRSVVAVNARRRLSSSGVYWRDGMIVTAAHTIRRTEDISVILSSGEIILASLAGADPSTDLAVLNINSGELSVPDFGDTQQAQVGHLVLAVGRGAQRGLNATLGMISVVSGAWRSWHGGLIDQFIGLDLTLRPGAAGGPLVDASSRILGINTSALSRSIALAIPVSTVNRVVQRLQKGNMNRGYLGLGMQSVPIPEELKNTLKRSADSGLIVVTVEPEGPGAKGGVQFGDVIVSFESTAVGSVRDLQPFLEPESVGKTIAVTLIRGGKPVEVNITIGERKRKDN